MLLLTSFLDLVRDTFEKRNANDLEPQAMPIIHCCYYVMGKTVEQEESFLVRRKRELYYSKE